MTGPPPEPAGKFVGFFRLLEACGKPGCPVCRCLASASRQSLQGLLYEQVTDPETRERLYGSWGFCNWHVWMLRQTSDPAFGSSILCEDLLGLAIRRFERATRAVTRHGGVLERLRRLFAERRRHDLPERFRARAVCPVCDEIARAEARYLGAALQFIDDPQFCSAYAESQGLCVPHAVRALELAKDSGQADRLIARTTAKWAELRRDLSGFVRKHDHRNREPFTEAEATGYLRAFEALAGAPEVFGNDVPRAAVRQARASSPRTPGTH